MDETQKAFEAFEAKLLKEIMESKDHNDRRLLIDDYFTFAKTVQIFKMTRLAY